MKSVVLHLPMAKPMAKIPVHLKHISWRNGKPRFEPGPAVRALKYAGKDLKHPDGRWYNLGETAEFSHKISLEIAERRQLKQAGKRLPALKGERVYCLDDLIDDMFKHQKYKQNTTTRGTRKLSENTLKTYKSVLNIARNLDAGVFACDIRAFRRKDLKNFHNLLWQHKSLATTNVIMAVIRLAFSFAVDQEKLEINPAANLGLPSPEGRIRVASPAEIEALVKAADKLNLKGVGDSILLGAYTGQRKGDRLDLRYEGQDEHSFIFKQHKTKTIVRIPQTQQLKTRLEAARARAKAARITTDHVIINSENNQPYVKSAYYKHYLQALDLAVKGSAAHGIEPTPSLADFRDQDLRDTAVTWLARAGATLPEICAVTGHGAKSAELIMKSYLQMDSKLSQNAITKMEAYLGAEKEADLMKS